MCFFYNNRATLSFYLDLVPGGTIVLISVALLILTLVYKKLAGAVISRGYQNEKVQMYRSNIRHLLALVWIEC